MNPILNELNKRQLFYKLEDTNVVYKNQSYNTKVVLSDIQEPYILHVFYNNSDEYFIKMTCRDHAVLMSCVFGDFKLEHSLEIIDSYGVKENASQKSERIQKWIEQEDNKLRNSPLPFEAVPNVTCVRCAGTGVHENSRKGNSCYQCKGKGLQTPQDIEDCARWKKKYYNNIAKQELDEITFMEEEFKRQMNS